MSFPGFSVHPDMEAAQASASTSSSSSSSSTNTTFHFGTWHDRERELRASGNDTKPGAVPPGGAFKHG